MKKNHLKRSALESYLPEQLRCPGCKRVGFHGECPLSAVFNEEEASIKDLSTAESNALPRNMCSCCNSCRAKCYYEV